VERERSDEAVNDNRAIDLINEFACGDCFMEKCESDCEYFLAKQALRERNDRGSWTPCAEGTPDIMRRVIVTVSGEIVIASKQHELDDDETTPIHWYDDEGCRFNDDVVTAWMPMPEPWTGGLDGK
jgi:hypothetical protein